MLQLSFVACFYYTHKIINKNKMILRPSLFKTIQNVGLLKTNYSTKPKELVFFMNDMVVAWHPPRKFPYEFTKPLPKVEAQPDGVLKVDTNNAHKAFKSEPPRAIIADELAALTYTTKHIWFPRARDKKNKKTPPNRPYL